MAAVAKKPAQDVKQYNFTWTGKDKSGKVIKGELRAGGESIVAANLRRQGIQVQSIKKVRTGGGKKITEKDITIFTRQLAVMMKAGVPLLQAFDIVGRGHANPSVGKLLLDIKTDVETGSSLGQAFRKYPRYFDALFCNLVAAGEQAGILDSLLDRLATYKEKILAIKGKIKSALFYPISIIVVALVVTAVIMIFVIPVFKELFKSFGADLPGPTLVVMAISDWFLSAWWWLFPGLFGGIWFFFYMWRRSTTMQRIIDRVILRVPVFGDVIRKASIARWCRTLSTMFAAGVPLVESLDIVGRGHSNPSVGKLLLDIKTDVETGSSLGQAFRKYPRYFDALFCNLVAAGEQAGILDSLLDRLATYKEKILAIKGKIKSALFYPISIIVVALVVTAVIMIFVIPVFKDLFKSFGADLPGPTLVVMAISDWFLGNWWWIFPGLFGGIWFFFYMWRRSTTMQRIIDRWILKVPVFGDVIRKASIARWCRTLSTMFAAGVPLVESLDSVAGAAGNYVYFDATKKIQNDVSTGTGLTIAMGTTGVFPSMVLQMVAIGEESGALDAMLSKVADFYEQEVDEAVDSLSSLMEPMIMVVLGVLIGGIVIAMYLPIFKMGQAI